MDRQLRAQEEIVKQVTDQIESKNKDLEAKESLIASLQQKLKEKGNKLPMSNGDDEKECGVCLETFSKDIKAMCFFPCGHARTCQDCYKKLNPKAKDSLGRVGKKCPQCQARIQNAALLFD